jgi:hypothetical protein
MAVVGSHTSNRRLRIFGSRSVSVRLVLLVAVALAGIATGATVLVNRPTGPLYGCSSVSDCRSVAADHHLKPLLLPDAKGAPLRFHDGTVDVDDEGDVSLVMNLADPSQPMFTDVSVGVDLQRNWVSMCSSPKARSATASSGLKYCSFTFGCDERAIFAAKSISYAVDVFGGPSCPSDFSAEASAGVQQILAYFD